jgi:YD repeat-containing protein
VQKNGVDQFTHSYAYDSYGRLATVADLTFGVQIPG